MTEQEVIVFKNILKNYRYYQAKVKELNAQINYMYSVMSGGGAIKYDGVRYAPLPQQFLITMEKKDKYEEQMKLYKHLIDWSDAALEGLSPRIRQCVMDIYADGKSFAETAEKYHYSQSGLYARITRELKRIEVK